MKLEIELPDYTDEHGISRPWVANHKITVATYDNKEIVIRANAEGLISLAYHCLILAQRTVPDGFHFHNEASIDQLEQDSANLVIERNNWPELV